LGNAGTRPPIVNAEVSSQQVWIWWFKRSDNL